MASSADDRTPAPHAHALSRKGEQPLWEQLHADLLRRLGRGEFSEVFPGEIELREQYGVSRHTVREALRRIRESGLIDSGRGRSTKVLATGIEQSLGGLYSLFQEVEARGIEQRSLVLDRGLRVDAHAARQLGRPVDEPLFYLERLRLAGQEPLAHDRVWLPADIGTPLLGADFTHAALYDELIRRSGVRPTGGSERISAVVPTPEQAASLQVPAGAACFAIERLGRVRNQPPIEYRLSLVRGDRFSLLTSWTPQGVRLGASGRPGTRGAGTPRARDTR